MYSLITDNGACSVNGELVTTCDISNVPFSNFNVSLSDCEADCTTHEPCVGYFYFELAEHCFLIPSTHSCPTGYSLVVRSVTAATSNDLEAGDINGYNGYNGEGVCYGKKLGNINLLKNFQFNVKSDV